jgi:hypothetical protein
VDKEKPVRSITSCTLAIAISLAGGCGYFVPEKKASPTKPEAENQALPGEPELPRYICRKISEPIVIDGVLNEPAWKRAVTTGRFGTWNAKETAQYETQARLMWDDEKLYIAFECEDEDIAATMRERDANLWEEHEICEAFIDPRGNGHCYYEFGFTPLNSVDDLIIPDYGAKRSLPGLKCWDCKGMVTAVKANGTLCNPNDKDKGWTVEISMPLMNFSGAPNLPPKAGDEWRINLYRWENSFGKIELQAWSPTLTPKPDPHVPRRFGLLKFAE